MRRDRQHATIPELRGVTQAAGNASMTKRMATAGMLVVCLCTAAAPARAAAQESSAALQALREYRSTTQHVLIACTNAFSARQASWRAVSTPVAFRSCVVRARTEVSFKLGAAVRALVAPEPALALRRYNEAFERALLGIEPQPGELSSAYEQRQAFLFHAMAHAWGQFELAEVLGD
jgi:hypothetical protein